jgi:hypothetical protein
MVSLVNQDGSSFLMMLHHEFYSWHIIEEVGVPDIYDGVHLFTLMFMWAGRCSRNVAIVDRK